MRYRLFCYVAEATQWDPAFVLERITDRTLLQDSLQDRLIFKTIRDAVYYVRDHHPNASIEYPVTFK